MILTFVVSPATFPEMHRKVLCSIQAGKKFNVSL